MEIRSSLLLPLPDGGTGHVTPGPALLLYGAQAGAFVDLAADLCWMSGLALSEYALDQHLSTIALPPAVLTVQATSVISQAIGVLIGRGRLPEKAHEELTVRAVEDGTDRYAAAVQILSTLATDVDPTHDPSTSVRRRGHSR